MARRLRVLGGSGAASPSAVESLLGIGKAELADDLLNSESRRLQTTLYDLRLPIRRWPELSTGPGGDRLLAKAAARPGRPVRGRGGFNFRRPRPDRLGRSASRACSSRSSLAGYALYALLLRLARGQVGGGMPMLELVAVVSILAFVLLHAFVALAGELGGKAELGGIGREALRDSVRSALQGWVVAYREAVESDAAEFRESLAILRAAGDAPPRLGPPPTEPAVEPLTDSEAQPPVPDPESVPSDSRDSATGAIPLPPPTPRSDSGPEPTAEPQPAIPLPMPSRATESSELPTGPALSHRSRSTELGSPPINPPQRPIRVGTAPAPPSWSLSKRGLPGTQIRFAHVDGNGGSETADTGSRGPEPGSPDPTESPILEESTAPGRTRETDTNPDLDVNTSPNVFRDSDLEAAIQGRPVAASTASKSPEPASKSPEPAPRPDGPPPPSPVEALRAAMRRHTRKP